jgi:hypothetical protein
MTVFDSLCWILERKIVLFPTNLVYGPPDGPPKDSVAINSTSTCEPVSLDGKEFAFKLLTKVPAEELILNCDSALERDDWIKAILDVANPPAADPSKSTEEIELEAEMNRLRIQHEKEAAEAEAAALAGESAMALRKEREEAAAAKQKAHEAAEARRLEDERLYKEKLAAQEAKTARLAFVAKPVSCNKKISTENSYQKRFVFVNADKKEFHWGKSEEDCKAATSKSVVLPTLIKAVTRDGSSFSLVFKDGAELPEHVWSKSVFSSTAPTSIDIQMESDRDAATFVLAIKDLM